MIPTTKRLISPIQPGINKIRRSSGESEYVGCDPVSSDVFYREIERAITGEEIPKYPYRYPERLVIPQGSPEGVPFQFFVHVTPYAEKSMYHFHSAMFGDKKILDEPLGFPLDKPSNFNIADLPNAYLKEFKVYHKEESEISESA
ncbi:arylphorin-like [Neodiprion lecontei]|uniref:Arylphorin-like n=1 Tax=Neodiprion lecontei TaxID=441921 RepID=A0ABM3GNY0_NEOLC|nr:arylphorin-like [Neodiprion lecontei]